MFVSQFPAANFITRDIFPKLSLSLSIDVEAEIEIGMRFDAQKYQYRLSSEILILEILPTLSIFSWE